MFIAILKSLQKQSSITSPISNYLLISSKAHILISFNKTELKNKQANELFSNSANFFSRSFYTYAIHDFKRIEKEYNHDEMLVIANQISQLIKLYPQSMMQLSVTEIQQSLIKKNAVGAVDINKQQVIGFMMLKEWASFRDDNNMPIIELCTGIIASAYQGKGLGKMLFDRLIKLARDKYPERKIIAVINNKNNLPIINIIKHYGAIVPTPKDLPNGKGDELVFEFNTSIMNHSITLNR